MQGARVRWNGGKCGVKRLFSPHLSSLVGKLTPRGGGGQNAQYIPLNCLGSTLVATSVPTGSTASASTSRPRCPRKCPSKYSFTPLFTPLDVSFSSLYIQDNIIAKGPSFEMILIFKFFTFIILRSLIRGKFLAVSKKKRESAIWT